MSKPKISFVLLERLLAEGCTVSQIAAKLGVQKGSVSKALKKLRLAAAKDTTFYQAGQIAERKFDALRQLSDINRHIHLEIRHIQEHLDTASGQERAALQDAQLLAVLPNDAQR